MQKQKKNRERDLAILTNFILSQKNIFKNFKKSVNEEVRFLQKLKHNFVIFILMFFFILFFLWFSKKKK